MALSLFSTALVIMIYYRIYYRSGRLKASLPREIGISGGGKGRLNIHISVLFANKGAKLGVVEDLRMKIEHKNKQTTLTWLGEEDSPPTTVTPVLPIPRPFSIGPQESVIKNCWFHAEPPETIIEGGTFTVNLMVLAKQKWLSCLEFELKIPKQVAASTSGGMKRHQLKNTPNQELMKPIAVHEVKF